MATPPLLNFEAITALIPGDDPAGIRLPPERRRKMEDARKEFEANPDNPAGSPIPKKPDWPGIIRQATDILTEDSKDLLTAARLTEALTRRNGFAGLRDGLKAMRLLVSENWDHLHPVIEEEADLEMRAGPFEWLNEPDSGALFPQTVKTIPLVRLGKLVVCCHDWNEGKVGDEPLPKDSGARGELLTPEVAADLAETLTELTTLEQILQDKMGNAGPNLISLRGALEECQRLINHLAPPRLAVGQADLGGGPGTTGGGGFGMPQGGGKAARDEIYRHLEHLARVLAEVEPHSPIPDLLHWAVQLGQMPFRQLLQELVREPTVLADIRRQFGIKEEGS